MWEWTQKIIGVTEKTAPDPASPLAVKQGCTCPLKYNNHGEGVRAFGERIYYINPTCSLHGANSNDVWTDDE